MEHLSPELLTSLLRDVSRSFYLTLRVLPLSIRWQVGLAYLLARATDTIADTDLIPVADRLDALHALRARIAGTSQSPLDFHILASQQATLPERVLLERAEEAINALAKFSYSDQQRIREVLATITTGQELDLQRFNGAKEQAIIALQTDAELDDYTFRVAGCVGEFWTRICCAHLFHSAKLDEPALIANGIRFGKGLQLVNILRDLPADLRQGRCYLPQQRLEAIGLTAARLLDPATEPQLRALYHNHLDLASAHLAAGWEYTNSLPRRFVRVRLACAWPVLIGIRTLSKLRRSNALNPSHRIKITRAEVHSIMAGTLWRYAFPAAWRELPERAAR